MILFWQALIWREMRGQSLLMCNAYSTACSDGLLSFPPLPPGSGTRTRGDVSRPKQKPVTVRLGVGIRLESFVRCRDGMTRYSTPRDSDEARVS